MPPYITVLCVFPGATVTWYRGPWCTMATWARTSLRTSPPAGRKAHHHKATETRQHSRDESALHSKGRVDKMMKSRQMDVWGEAVKGEEERTGESMSSSRSTEQRSHCSRVNARCMIFLTIFSRSVCSSNRSLTTSNRACMTTVKHYKSVVHDVTLLYL